MARPLRDDLRLRLVSAVERKRLTVEQVALRSGFDERTIQRLLSGQTLSLVTLEQVAESLRVDLLAEDRDAPVEPMGAHDSTKTPSRAVVGWRQAARVLGVHRNTLRARRRAVGCTRWPWWPDEQAVREWFDGMIGEVG